jgi:hypothetical protein
MLNLPQEGALLVIKALEKKARLVYVQEAVLPHLLIVKAAVLKTG